MNHELPANDEAYEAVPVTLGPIPRPAVRRGWTAEDLDQRCTEMAEANRGVMSRPLPERQKPQAASTAPSVDYAQYVQQLQEAGFSEAFAMQAARTQMAIEQA